MSASQELLDKIAGRRIVASVSGGKDSAAARLYLREIGIPDSQVINVAMDTGWEWSGWRAYVDGPLAAVIGPITIIGNPEGLAAVAVRKGMFPSRLKRWCTDLLKMGPFAAFLSLLQDDGIDPIVMTGIRYDESAARAKFVEWEWNDGFDAEQWRPILAWTVQDVIDIHQRHGLAPNPLYLKGAKRVGCWPCIYAGKNEIKLVADIDPGRIDEIRALEASVTVAAEAIVRKRGEELKQPRTFFHSRAPAGGATIDEVVAWSRTLRGGRTEDKRIDLLQSAGMNDGCMRWGLCETIADDDDDARGLLGSVTP